MPADSQNDDVHVLTAAESRRGSRAWIAGVVALLLIAGAGVAVLVLDPFAGELVVEAAAPAADNLLGDHWSFERTERGGPETGWRVAEGAPAGFSFVESAAVSGELGASFAGGDGARWARTVAIEPIALGSRRESLEVSARGLGERTHLLVVFEAPDRPALPWVVAAGPGDASGTVAPPPGYDSARVAIGAVGEGRADDLLARRVDGVAPSPERQGNFELLEASPGLLVTRGTDLALVVQGPTVRTADDRALDPVAAYLPGEGRGAVAVGDATIPVVRELRTSDARATLTTGLERLPEGARLEVRIRVGPLLAASPVGVTSEVGYEAFSGDLRVSSASAIVLGDAQTRLQLSIVDGVEVQAVHAADGIALTLTTSRPTLVVDLQTSFQAERIEAAQLRDLAREHEAAGLLGEALVEYQQIVRDLPHDEAVLREAQEGRARLLGRMQTRLDAIDADLDDALFLASASRCREVLADAQAAEEAFAGSDAAAEFAARVEEIAERAANLLEADRARRAGRVRAVRDSFAAAGGYALVVAELDRYLVEHLGADGIDR